ncbi:inverse autotransporter beta domain-containing protein, partial [Enterobacter mori]
MATVAAKYNMSVEQLRKLNQFRTFAHEFDRIEAGDELDVPLAPLPTVQWNDGKTDTLASADVGAAQAQTVASAAAMAGGFLSADPNGDTAGSMARGIASGAASGEVQQWLSQFGTARVQLDVDENFSLKNSKFDLLVPLYDKGSNLIFTQGSLHRTDDRTQANFGTGIRYFTPTYMVGGNLFGDYDVSRDHARAGAGVEYWRDFLKLGANGYMRLTGWKDSPDLADYQERPANGWDIRAQAWLPALPQLGGKLTYEQFYGDEVALFGVDNRQRNPHAITAGVNYTPVPLVTLSAEQRQGQSGTNDTRFGIEMNYQLGVPWRNQMDPDAVAALRSLTGSRYDLVERNNNIVLEYRKKEVLRLHMADLVTGYGGEQKSLGVSVTSKYGLKTIEWNAASLESAGGKIVQNGTDYAVVLPAWQATHQDGNTYTVSGVAVDTKGNRSERSETQVSVQAPVVSSANSTFTPATITLSADGKSAQVLTLAVKDDKGGAIDAPLADISFKVTKAERAAMKVKLAATNTVISALTSGKNKGEYEVTVTAGTSAEELTLTPIVQGVTLAPAKVSIISAVPAQTNSAITRDKASYTAGESMTVSVTLKDASGNPVMGQVALLTGTTVIVDGATLNGNWKDNGDGTYTATYTATTAGENLTATLKLNEWSGNKQSAVYSIVASAPSETTSVIKTDNTSYISGTDMVVTVTLKD